MDDITRPSPRHQLGCGSAQASLPGEWGRGRHSPTSTRPRLSLPNDARSLYGDASETDEVEDDEAEVILL